MNLWAYPDKPGKWKLAIKTVTCVSIIKIKLINLRVTEVEKVSE